MCGYRINLKGEKIKKTMSIDKERGSIFLGFILCALLAVSFLTVIGCDEGMNMVPPPPPTEEPTEPTEPTTNGEVKQPEEPTEPTEPTGPTVTIGGAEQADDGSITVSGVSTDLPEGTNIAVTFGDSVVRAYGRTNAEGAWVVTVSASEAKDLPTGTVAVTAAATGVAPDTGSVEYTPPPQPTIIISAAAQSSDGSVRVYGRGTNLPAGTTVTVTLGETVTATAAISSAGIWTVTVPAAKAEDLPIGTVMVTVAAAEVSAVGSYEHTVQTTHGIPTPTKADEIKVGIVVDVYGYDVTNEKELGSLRRAYDYITSERDLSSFDVETEAGREVFQRVVRYEEKKTRLSDNPPSFEEELRILREYFAEAFGITSDFAFELLKIYIEENPDKEYLFGGWKRDNVGIAWLIVKQANPDATDEEMLEHFRQASREKVFTISG